MGSFHSKRLGIAGAAARLAAVAMLIALGSLPVIASAHTAADLYQAQGATTLTVPAGGTASFTARGFCLDFGKPFPTGNMAPKGLADDKVRAALDYSIQKGYTNGNPQQVELAVWFLRDGTWHNASHDVAQEIVNSANSATPPSSTGNGTSLVDAVSQNKVTLTAQFTAQTAGHYYGDATIQVKNSGTADLTIFVPVGTAFTVPGSNGQFQDLAVYSLGTQQTGTPAAQTTATTAATAAATGTTAATAEATGTTAATAAATGTTAATAPAETATTAATAPVETATTAATAPAETATTAATAPVETATTAPAETATTAPVETATTAPVEQPTAAPTATQVAGGAVLPKGGAGDGDLLALIIGATGLALGLVTLGAALRMGQSKG